MLHLPVEERVSKGVELPEGLVGVHHQRVAGDHPLAVAVHHRDEAVRGGLGSDAHAREVLLQEVPAAAEMSRQSDNTHIFFICCQERVVFGCTETSQPSVNALPHPPPIAIDWPLHPSRTAYNSGGNPNPAE